MAEKYSMLKEYLNKEVTVQVAIGKTSETVTGVLVSYQPAFILKTSKGISIYEEVRAIHLKDTPEGILLKPSLKWKILSDDSVETQCLVSYMASSITWKALYVATLNDD